MTVQEEFYALVEQIAAKKQQIIDQEQMMQDLFDGKLGNFSSKAINNSLLIFQDEVRSKKGTLRFLEEKLAALSINLDETPFGNETIEQKQQSNLLIPALIIALLVLA